MRKEESKLWTRIAGHMPRITYPDLRLERVEALINDGMPDIHCLAKGRTSWVELKQVADYPKAFRPVLPTEHQKLSQDQKNWHMDYRRCGGRVATLVGIGSYDYVLVDGSYSDTINEMSWPLMDKACIMKGKAPVFFPSFYNWLLGMF